MGAEEPGGSGAGAVPRGGGERSLRELLTPRLVLGLVVVVAGLLALLDELGLLETELLASWWPAGLAVLGLVQLVAGDNPLAKVVGLVLVLLGGALVFAHLNPDLLRSDDVWELAWPAALVVLGGFLVVRALRPTRVSGARRDGADRLRAFAFWSGQERRVGSQRFEGGELTAFMGGLDVDLREADLPPGAEAVLDVFVVMGGGEIKIPEGWTVESDVLPLLGGVSVKARSSPDPDAPPKRLRLEGLVVMGGLEVKN